MFNACRLAAQTLKGRFLNLDPSRPALALTAALVIALFSTLLISASFTSPVVHEAYDLLLKTKARLSPPVRPAERSPVVIIAIDDQTVGQSQLAVPELMAHHHYVEILTALYRGGARAVALNRVLPRSEDAFSAPADVIKWFNTIEDLRDELPVLSGVVWRQYYLVMPATRYLLSLEPATFGFLNFTRDSDNRVRRQLVRWPGCQSPIGCLSLSLLAARTLKPDLPEPAGEFYIDFDPRPRGGVPVFSFLEVYRRARAGDLGYVQTNFQDKLVLVGEINFLNRGSLETPFSDSAGSGDTSVEITAQAVLTLLSGTYIKSSPPAVSFFLVLLMTLVSLVPLMLSQRCGPYPGLWLPSALIVLYGLVVVFFFTRHYYLPVVTGLTALTLAQIFCLAVRSTEGRLATRTSLTALSLYLTPALASQIVKHPDFLSRTGQRREMTVFFSDLVGFTTVAEHISPEDLVRNLNRYFEAMEPLITARGGILDKFGGDSIMAFWGSPLLPREDHAASACLAALDQQRAITGLNKVLLAEKLPLLSALMGLNTGPMIVGNIGARNRLNYTVMGDAVNLASRLVSVNKVYGTRIVVSRAVAERAGEAVELRLLDRVTVPGRRESLTIYEVMEAKGELDEARRQGRDLYEEGLVCYFKRDFASALSFFEKSLQAVPDDGPGRALTRRCREFLNHPPGEDWQGVTALEVKAAK